MKQSSKLQLAFFLIIWGIFLLAGFFYAEHQRPTGDEPHYLIIAQSLIKDHDLDLKNNYNQKDYRAWGYPIETLDAHISVNSQNHKSYSVHSIGWPLVFLPFFALAGRIGITFFTSLIATALVFNLYLLIRHYTKNNFVAIAISTVIGFSAPILTYSTQIFNEIFGALLTLYAYRKIVEKSNKPLDQFLIMLAIAYLPWVHIKYLFLSLVLLISYLITNFKNKKIFWGIIYLLSISVLGYFLHHFYGSFSPNAQYPSSFSFNFLKIGQGALGLLLDRTFGLLSLTPVYFFSLAGFYFLYQKDHRVFWLTLIIFLSLFLVQAAGATAIGWAPAGRFLVVFLPLLVLPITEYYIHFQRWGKIIFWHLASWSFLVGYLLIRHPDLNYSTAKPVFLTAISPSFTNLGKYFPALINIEQYPDLTTKTILITVFWLIIILGLNLIIIKQSKKS